MKELFAAIQAGDTPGVGALLLESPGAVNARNDSGVSAFLFAKYNGKGDIAQLLVDRGAALDVFDVAAAGDAVRLRRMIASDAALAQSFSADGWTPLHLAAFFGHPECAAALLDAGAKVNERSTNAMHNMPIHAAAAGRRTELVRLLIERGAYVNARQHGGWSALHAAAQNGDVTMAQLLIAAGADVPARADNQQTALDLALGRGHQEMVEVLEHYGAAGA
jgi:ankyrin repeat protein